MSDITELADLRFLDRGLAFLSGVGGLLVLTFDSMPYTTFGSVIGMRFSLFDRSGMNWD